MAKIVIAGDAIVVTSAMKLEDIKTIEKYRPNALTLMGGEDGKEPIFAIGTTEGCGNINQVGASPSLWSPVVLPMATSRSGLPTASVPPSST